MTFDYPRKMRTSGGSRKPGIREEAPYFSRAVAHKDVVYSSKESFSCLLQFAVKKALAPSVAVLLATIKTDQKGWKVV
jgi:hypothetical protein